MYNRLGILGVIGTCVAVALPGFGSAAEVPGNMAVGEVEAILQYCARIDPRVDVERHLTVLTGRVSPDVRTTDGYKQGYDLMSDALAKSNKAQAVLACAPLATDRDRDRKDHDHDHGR
jgi:hypothetical protein